MLKDNKQRLRVILCTVVTTIILNTNKRVCASQWTEDGYGTLRFDLGERFRQTNGCPFLPTNVGVLHFTGGTSFLPHR